jgi:hypothetical protein
MKLCAACNAQFDDSQQQCMHCGGHLTDDPAPARSAVEIAALEGHVRLARQQPIWIRPLLEALTERKIPFVIVADGAARNLNWLYGGAETEASVEVFVPETAVSAARDIQARVAAASLPALPADYDPGSVDGEHCPACGAALPDSPECTSCGLFLG